MTHVLAFSFRRGAALVFSAVTVCALAAWTAPFHLHLVKSVPAANATIAAVSYEGTFSSRFGLPATAATETNGPRRRANFALGTGSARVEAESFQGTIILTRPGDAVARPKE